YLSFGAVICVQSERRKSTALGYIFSQFSDSVCNFNASLLFGKEYAISDKKFSQTYRTLFGSIVGCL
ncbi:hypothetical protein, partial [Staphylococcus pseudintermedius]|uniref:hypothetical protein n=1 Tax=Staphylococcus pseudintermedius TaxID=283734 RepID=UPI001C6E6207